MSHTNHSTEAPAPQLPCSGMRVLDLTSNIAGPLATMVLAALGADVIKVERPVGDDARRFGPFIGDRSLAFAWANSGKRSVAVDLKTPEGKQLIERLLPRCDVVAESFRPGVMDRLGFDLKRIKELAPDAIVCDINAFGNDSPGAPSAGYDPVVQAFSGMMTMNGHDGQPPVRAAQSIVDVSTGQWAAIGILAAYLSRQRFGEGRFGHVETTLFDAAMSLMPQAVADAVITSRRPPRYGSGNPIAAPYEAFQAEDAYVFIAAPSESLWQTLVRAIDRADLLDDPRYATNRSRVEHKSELRADLETTLRTRKAHEWIELLERAGVPSTRVNHLDEVVSGEVPTARRTIVEYDGLPVVRIPLLVDDDVLICPRPAPAVGEHTREVLDELGYTPDEADAFMATIESDSIPAAH